MLDSIVAYGRSETKVKHGRLQNDKDEKQNLAEVNTLKRCSM